MWDEKKCVEMVEAIAQNNMEHQSFRRRLTDLESSSRKQSEILVMMQKQSDNIENMAKSMAEVKTTVDKIDKRVSKIEQEPADKWKKISLEIIKYIILAALGFAIGRMFNG